MAAAAGEASESSDVITVSVHRHRRDAIILQYHRRGCLSHLAVFGDIAQKFIDCEFTVLSAQTGYIVPLKSTLQLKK